MDASSPWSRREDHYLLSTLRDQPRRFPWRRPANVYGPGVRDFIAKRYRHYGRHSIRIVQAAVRMFLRYLWVEGRCSPGLDQALTSAGAWCLQALPQRLTSEAVQKIRRSAPRRRRASATERSFFCWPASVFAPGMWWLCA